MTDDTISRGNLGEKDQPSNSMKAENIQGVNFPSLVETVEQLVKRFDGQMELFRGDYSIEVTSGQIIEVCQWLRDEAGFEMLIDETAVDYWPQETPRFKIIYQLRSIARNEIISLRIGLDGNEPVAPSLVGVYRNADWYERELWDLFGIRFYGHKDLRRLLMPHDWVGHPLRKDYPLGYEEPQFTFNFEQIQARKLNPKS